MKTKHFGKLALLLASCLAVAGTAQASIEAFTNLLTENGRIYNYNSTTGAIGPIVQDTVELTVVSSGHSSAATANINSIPGFSATTIGPTINSAGFDTKQAGGIQSLAGLPAQGAGAVPENFFDNWPFGGVNPVGVDPHGYADTNGTGALILPGGGLIPPTDATATQVSTVANVNLSENPVTDDDGNATANTGVTAAFIVNNISGGPLDLLLQFDAYTQQLVDLDPVPPGISGSVDNSWTFAITSALTGVTNTWSPDGILDLPVPGQFTELSDPFDLNGGPSGFPGFQTGPITNATAGFTGIDGGSPGAIGLGGPNFAAWITVAPGPHSVVITHESSARADTFGIPEASSCIVWGFLALLAGGYRRRRVK